MMKVLGIYGSPREEGNSDLLLGKVLEGAKAAGAEVSSIRPCDLDISGCLECGGCDETGECVIDDDMQTVYPEIEEADVIVVASPIFFYGFPSQLKALIDRCQAMWSRRMLEKTPEQRRKYDSGKGYLVAVGATKGKNLFNGVEFVAKYFFDALDMSYESGLFYSGVEGKGAIAENREAMNDAFDFGKKISS